MQLELGLSTWEDNWFSYHWPEMLPEITLLLFIHYTAIPCKALKAYETQLNFVSQAVSQEA